MVEKTLCKGGMPLLRALVSPERSYHGPHRPHHSRREIHQRQYGSLLQGMQQQKEISAPDGMVGLSERIFKRITYTYRCFFTHIR